jgi:hypothetical protein
MTRWILALAPLLASCSALVPAPDVSLEGLDPQAAWSRHLAAHVDESGTIDFDAMKESAPDLDVFVAWIAEPRSTKLSSEEEVAYLVNAYNALAMYGVLHSGVLPKSKIRFFYFCEFEENDREISLYDYENDVIRKRGDPRIHFALNCMVRACPRLPNAPFRAEILDEQLDAAAREFFNDTKHVQLDAEARVVRFSLILDWYEEDFLAVAPSLIAYANRYRTEPIPEDWRVKFLTYDWTLQSAHPASSPIRDAATTP